MADLSISRRALLASAASAVGAHALWRVGHAQVPAQAPHTIIPPDPTPQLIDGLTSTSEWTGVPLATLFREVGVKPGAKWLLAEGADAAVMARSIPMDKAADDALIAYGQNGEALRPEQGYPARLR